MESNQIVLETIENVWNNMRVGENTSLLFFQRHVAREMGTKCVDFGIEERRLILKFLINTSKSGISKITTKTEGRDIIFTKLENLRKRGTRTNKADNVRKFINSLPIGTSLTIDALIKKYYG